MENLRASIKNILISTVLTVLYFNLTAQNPPKTYPYGDEFLLGFYDLNSDYFGDYDTLAQMGWNTAHSYIDHGDLIEQNTYHTTVQNNNLNAFPLLRATYIGRDNPNSSTLLGDVVKHPYIPTPDFPHTTQEQIQQQMIYNFSMWSIPEELRKGYYLTTVQNDYPAIDSVREFDILEQYPPLIRQLDPKERPVEMFCLPVWRKGLQSYVPHLDVLTIGVYPDHGRGLEADTSTIIQRQIPHSYVRRGIEMTQNAIIDTGYTLGKDYLNGEKTVIAALELYYATDVQSGNPIDTLTTIPKKTWHDFWLALACDVKGIMMYSYRGGKDLPNLNGDFLHDNLDTLHHAVSIFKANQLGKVLLQGTIDTSVSMTNNVASGPDSTHKFFYEPWQGYHLNSDEITHYESVKKLTKKWQGNTYVFAANSTEDSVKFTIPFSTDIPSGTLGASTVVLPVEELITGQTLAYPNRYDDLNSTGFYKGFIIHTLPPFGAAVFKYNSSHTLDLSIRDCNNDNGYNAGYRLDLEDIDNSPDIWVRNQDDGFTNQTHQQPLYSTSSNGTVSNTNYVYVRVKNISGVTSDGTETLSLHWTRNGMNPTWPDVWDGSNPNVGNLINTLNIPVLVSGQDTILEFMWNIVADTSQVQDWGHCLLARMDAGTDAITDYYYQNNGSISSNPTNSYLMSTTCHRNNNVALRNCNILHLNSWFPNSDNLYPIVRTENTTNVFAANSSDTTITYDFTFKIPKEFRLSSIVDSTNINLQFNANAWNLFQAHCQSNPNVTISGEQRVSLNANEVVFKNVVFPANTSVPIGINFDFLIQEANNDGFEFVVSQQKSLADSTGNYERGNVRFVVQMNPIEPFSADAGADKEIDRGESVTLSAEQINAAATYNWYDMDGNLIYTGTDVSVSPEDSRRYHLEIIANGISAYDAVAVAVNPYFITAMSPNPASGIVNIDYSADGASVAYIMLINQNTGTADMYPINTYDSQKSINVAYYSPGTYTVLLICDGVYYSPQSLSVY